LIRTASATNLVKSQGLKSQGLHDMTTGMSFVDIKSAVLSGWSLLIMIGATIAFNALFMQQAPHPAPFYVTRDAAIDAGQPVAPAKAKIRSVQTGLKKLGYYSGAVDGIAGPETEMAITRFERAARLAVTGRADEALLAKLNHALTPQVQAQHHGVAESTGPAKAKAPPPDPMVAVIQKALSDAAYGPLTSDGIMGRWTIDAISRFQLDQGMTVTGAIDDALIARLIEIGAMDGGHR
jgi:peptidoglycan hydrolase-like protein with peptidoglycan-binding domain